MYKFEVYYKLREQKVTGRKFKSFFTTSTKDGHSMSVRFTKECKVPERACVLYVKPINARISIKNGFEYLVISGFEKIEKIEDKRLQNYFDELSDEFDDAEGPMGGTYDSEIAENEETDN